ncbi:DUF4350 domain-containing protein [Cellulomonas cellasea]|uniref:DUF4350 domain-containing protein n=1 Tax=Cellulomonas cellasea TaxID=43670 RepID=A0A4Y3KWY3_9CELL|nr:DUF4350 domain-containing protein [Cellulomonas cellasea]GEA88632.1 hypothetical protein CCE01nite_25810 [Cellulomonas cellasea]
MSTPAPVSAPGGAPAPLTAPEAAGTSAGAAPGPGPAPVTVTGDGSTARSRAGSRWRRWRFPLAVLSLLVLVGLLAALPEPRTSTVALAPDNAAPEGARAVAQVLGDQGVEVTYVRRTSEAVAAADAGTTLLVTGDALLGLSQMEDLAATGADLVLLDPTALLDEVTTAATRSWSGPDDTAPTTRTARCEDPTAAAAETFRSGGPGFTVLAPGAVTCFPTSTDDEGSGAYLVVEGERRVTAFADTRFLRNDTVADEGHAALALRALGRHEQLTWYVPSLDDFGDEATPAGPGIGDLLPPVAEVLALQLLVVVGVAALWRGRRLGRVVTEPLPVTVRAAETTRGRGRLYRRARSYGHAAAALRAGTAARCAQRLGLPRSAGAHAVIDALAQATRRPADEVAGLLYGPPPKDDAGLAQLARRLDELESEVHRS